MNAPFKGSQYDHSTLGTEAPITYETFWNGIYADLNIFKK